MLTLRDIAAQYGLSKSTARRRVLECFEEMEVPLSIEQGKALQLDSEQAAIFADWMKKRGAVHESALNQSESVASSAAESVEPDSSGGFTLEQVQALINEAVQAEQVKRIEQERDALLNQLEQANRRIESQEEEIQRLHSALEREQMKSVGFWNRLGQRLLGSGK